jgi:hypothetical protein
MAFSKLKALLRKAADGDAVLDRQRGLPGDEHVSLDGVVVESWGLCVLEIPDGRQARCRSSSAFFSTMLCTVPSDSAPIMQLMQQNYATKRFVFSLLFSLRNP